ncbi:MAG: chorismate mutase [Pseudonocardiaceae bacterium]
MRLILAVLATTLAVAASATPLSASAVAPPTAGKTSRSEPLLALTDVAAQRLQLADTVAAAKWGTDAPINDPAREQAVLNTVVAKSTQLGINPVVSVAVFTDQIEASKAVQYGLYSRWSAHPGQAPRTRPDLGQVRPILDRMTDQLLAELKVTQQLRAEPSCAARLTGARHRVEHARRLDPLHEDALARALTSICR